MYVNRTVTVVVITALLLVGCILAASAGTIGTQRAQAHQAVVAATTDARRVEVAATMEAEKAKAAQIRETYEGQAEVIGAQADAYVQRHAIDMTFYALKKSEDRQDEMLYFVLNGESKQKTEIRTATVLFWSFAGVATLFVGAVVVSANWAQIVGIFVALRELARVEN